MTLMPTHPFQLHALRNDKVISFCFFLLPWLRNYTFRRSDHPCPLRFVSISLNEAVY